MIGPMHASKFGCGHVTSDALVSQAVGLVMRVLRRIVDLVFMTGHTSLVGLVLSLELVPTTGSVAMEAIQISRLHAGAHEPGGVCVILTQITSIRVVVGIFKSDQTKMIEESVPRLEGFSEHNGLGMTTGACSVVLLLGKVTPTAC